MLEKNFTTIVFGATSLIGKSIIQSNPKKIVYISRKKKKRKILNGLSFLLTKKAKLQKKGLRLEFF